LVREPPAATYLRVFPCRPGSAVCPVTIRNVPVYWSSYIRLRMGEHPVSGANKKRPAGDSHPGGPKVAPG